MSLPKPPFELDGHCSTVHDDTLYVLASSGFASLPLKENDDAQWSKEKTGQAVAEASCVMVASTGEDSKAWLYVIGGQTDQQDYGGLQRYSFSDKAWETLPTVVNVLAGRTNHSVAFLEDSESILVYAGSQPQAPSVLSSQTFLISTQPPYNIRAFTSDAPPANMPILQAWNSSHAIMLGGTTDGTGIYTWAPSSGWDRFGTNLTKPIDGSSRGTIIDGEAQSKVLQLFDFSVSPNVVESIVLQDADGRPAPPGQTVGTGGSTQAQARRALSIADWPSYNNTEAPTTTRTDCSIAEAANGLSVMAGGSDTMPIALFNRSDNSWVDADRFFDSKQQQPLLPSITTSTALPSATSSPTSSSTPVPGSSSGESTHDRTLRTLGITLGVLCGIAALFILVLLWLRWRKIQQRKKTGYVEEKPNDRMSFADVGATFMKEAGGSVNELALPPRNRYESMGGSRSSLAIIAGKFGKRSTNSHAPKTSCESTTRLVRDQNGNPIIAEPVEMIDMEKKPPFTEQGELQVPGPTYDGGSSLDRETKQSRKRSSGWSKYFAASQPGPHLSHIPSVYIKQQQHFSDGSHYSSDVAAANKARVPSALVSPIDVNFDKVLDGQRLSHVATHSPQVLHPFEDPTRRGSEPSIAQHGQIVNAEPRRSMVSGRTISTFDAGDRSTLNSNMTDDFFAEHGDNWTPVGGGTFKDHIINARPPSSNYTNSVYETDTARKIPSRGRSAGFFPGAGTSYRPSSRPRTANSGQDSSAPSKTGVQPGGITNGLTLSQPVDTRGSTMTLFPSASNFDNPPSNKAATAKTAGDTATKPMTTDISWINLGDK